MTAPNLSRPEEDVRLQCLELAVQACATSGQDCVPVARAFFDFVSGDADLTPRDRILRALEDAGVR